MTTPLTPDQRLDYGTVGLDESIDNTGRARWAVRLIYVYVGLLVAQFFFNFVQQAMLAGMEDRLANLPPGQFPFTPGEVAIFGVATCFGLISFGVMVGGIVAYMMWQYRAARIRAARGTPTDVSAGMGVGWWFIPLANLVMPVRVMLDLWRSSDVERVEPARPVWWVAVPFWLMLTCLIGLWTALIIDVIADVRAGVEPFGDEWVDPTSPLMVLFGVATTLLLIASLLGLSAFVKGVQRRQAGPDVPVAGAA